ncbi:hypothetical protein ACFC1V_39855, partial [Streptomyces sp. NPDC056069]
RSDLGPARTDPRHPRPWQAPPPDPGRRPVLLQTVEAVWSLVRGAMANTAFDTPDDLDRKLRRELRRIQLRPRLTDGCLSSTGLVIDPPTPT